MELTLLEEPLALCRLPAGAGTPSWLDHDGGSLVSVTSTADETSIVCPAAWIPPSVRREQPWRGLKLAGPLDLEAVGILAGLTATLAADGVSVFAISTFDTDYVLVRDKQLGAAVDALSGAGHTISA